ncbi:hypothetical protein GCM10027091_68970 [Streptomyces daliensis]
MGTTRATGPPHANEPPKGHPHQAHPHEKHAPREAVNVAPREAARTGEGATPRFLPHPAKGTRTP